MSDDPQNQEPAGESSAFNPPVSTFLGPIGELVAQRMLLPPSRPGILAVLDRFEILRVLGSGGMGMVLLARDPATDREVAIKLIRAELSSDQNVVHRFLKEAGHLKRLRHTNILPVEEIHDHAQCPFIVMPFFEQGSLANRIQPGHPLDPDSILDIATQIAEGLSFAHRSGIIHRDLKPANILLMADGTVCLADFGLARTVFNDSIINVESRQLEGTVPYMSPGVAAGDAEDTRCDIYSFGAVLYEMLTGRRPYDGRGFREVLNQITTRPPEPITSLNPSADPGLAAVAEVCMARQLRDRYADMRDVLEDLQRLRENLPPLGQRGSESAAPTGVSAIHFATWLVWTGVVAALCVLLALLWLRPFLRHHLPAPTTAAVQNHLKLDVTTLAGRPGVAGYADGSGRAAEFRLPGSVAVDNSGHVFVADAANHVIRKIDPNGTVSLLAGHPVAHGSTDGVGDNARFSAPFGVAADRMGNLYVADTVNNTIRKVTPEGEVSNLAGSAGNPGSNDGTGEVARFRNPWGIAVNDTGDVFVADLSNDTIRKITPGGQVTTIAGLAGHAGEADGPSDEARFDEPNAIAIDHEGNLYVSDGNNNTIRKITAAGMVTTLAGTPGHAGYADGQGVDAWFSNPRGLALDQRNNIFVIDGGSDTIRVITPAGDVTTVAGLPGVSGATDGTGANARFNGPSGIAVDSSGTLFVADAENNTIRKITVTLPTAY